MPGTVLGSEDTDVTNHSCPLGTLGPVRKTDMLTGDVVSA